MFKVNGFDPIKCFTPSDTTKVPYRPVWHLDIPTFKTPLDEDVFVRSPNIKVPYDPYYVPTFGEEIAFKAQEVASRRDSVGSCYSAVAEVLLDFDVIVWGESAYMAANQLARYDKFEEIDVTREDLKSLDPGCIVVWDKCEGHPDGHISISLGYGREASDHISKQLTSYGPRFRVFKPVEEEIIAGK